MVSLPSHLQSLVDALVLARLSGRPIAELDFAQAPATAGEAYAVDQAVADRLGWESLGWKIAGTTVQVREALGLNAPIYGRIYRRHRHVSPVRLPAAELMTPMVECEFFVTLGEALPPRKEPYILQDIEDAVATVHAGIEIAELRIPSLPSPPTTFLLADASAAGNYIFGPEIDDWKTELRDCPVEVEINGEIAARGQSQDVMGHPLKPLLWLANARSEWGDGLKAGEMISTGSMTGYVSVARGDRAVARFKTKIVDLTLR